jgi:hypothetical protein
MLEFLPKEVRDGIAAARAREQRRRSRLHARVGDAVFPILRLWDEGFALDSSLAPPLRGMVDVYDGSRHILRCLVITSTAENGELVCDFKRATNVSDRAPLDYWLDRARPAGLVTKG